MSQEAFMQRCWRALGGSWPPVAAWLLGMAMLAVVGVESMFVEQTALFVYARLTAYITAMMLAAVVFGMVVVFALSCGLMLWWLDGRANVRVVAGAVYRSLWLLAVYMWIGVALLLVDPPAALTMDDIARTAEVQADLQALPALRWLERMRYIVAATFVALVAWLLARTSKPLNAVLAAAFGAATVSATVALLGLVEEEV